MSILDTLRSFEFDRNKKRIFGIKSAIVWGHSKTSNSSSPLLYISKPKHVSQKDFDFMLEHLDLTFYTEKKIR
jgi:hypothetical protein